MFSEFRYPFYFKIVSPISIFSDAGSKSET